MPDKKPDRMPITAHLEELRKRLLYSVVALAAGFGVSFNYSEELLAWMQLPLTITVGFTTKSPFVVASYTPSPTKLVFLAPAEAFWMYMKIAFVAGIFLALPFILAQIWLFISPGLLPKERRYALPFVVSATLMFVMGALFCQYFILPFAIKFLLTYQTAQLTPMISVGNYIDFCSKFLLSFGLIFELPLAITLLSKLGVVTPQFLAKNRKYAILLAFVAAAILTPTPDAFNQVLMAAPILVLYEVGIIMARLVGKKREAPAPDES
jgi:sec-independent protein translocase protein TatC